MGWSGGRDCAGVSRREWRTESRRVNPRRNSLPQLALEREKADDSRRQPSHITPRSGDFETGVSSCASHADFEHPNRDTFCLRPFITRTKGWKYRLAGYEV